MDMLRETDGAAGLQGNMTVREGAVAADLVTRQLLEKMVAGKDFVARAGSMEMVEVKRDFVAAKDGFDSTKDFVAVQGPVVDCRDIEVVASIVNKLGNMNLFVVHYCLPENLMWILPEQLGTSIKGP